MPVYNEEANLRKTVESWYPVCEAAGEASLLLIDDGSRDRSPEILAELCALYPRLEYFSKENEGHGPTIHRAYREALDRGADYVFQTDSDGQTDPDDFRQMWEKRAAYKMQIGRREKREDGFSRKFVSFVLRVVLFLFFGEWTEDPNTPFRLMEADCLERFIRIIPPDFGLTNAVLSVFAAYSGVSMRSVPVHLAPRQAGVNSINLPRIVRMALENMKRFPALRRAMRRQLKGENKDAES